MQVAAQMQSVNDGNKVKISVKDTGIGIRQQDKQKLFQLFSCIKDEKN